MMKAEFRKIKPHAMYMQHKTYITVQKPYSTSCRLANQDFVMGQRHYSTRCKQHAMWMQQNKYSTRSKSCATHNCRIFQFESHKQSSAKNTYRIIQSLYWYTSGCFWSLPSLFEGNFSPFSVKTLENSKLVLFHNLTWVTFEVLFIIMFIFMP